MNHSQQIASQPWVCMNTKIKKKGLFPLKLDLGVRIKDIINIFQGLGSEEIYHVSARTCKEEVEIKMLCALRKYIEASFLNINFKLSTRIGKGG